MKIFFAIFVFAPFMVDNGTVHQKQVNECTLTFEILNAGFVTSGTLDAQILENTFNPAVLDKSSVIVVAVPSTIKTGIAIRDKHLQRPDFFDSERYPHIKLKSKSFKKVSRNKFVGRFDLSIKDKVREVNAPILLDSKDPQSCHGSFSINRRDFDIGGESMTLVDEVVIKFRVQNTDVHSGRNQ